MQLSLGLFFDGTGNNRRDRPRQTVSNVAKLFDVYGSDDDPSTARLYVRGVGSKKLGGDDDPFGGETIFGQGIDRLLGGAFGVGGHDRIEWMLRQARELVHSRQGLTRLDIDLFGFSRGAALARHFVHRLVREPLHHSQSIRFLGIFDTVGSFGIPGDNKDPFDFRVRDDVVRHVYHLVAENELRRNFDLHSVRPMDRDWTFDDDACRGERWMVEILCPGVHSDIGGSYNLLPPGSRKPQHDNDNNLLARVYLDRMHAAARGAGVPFVPPPPGDREEFWDVDSDIRRMLSNILGYYQRLPALRTMHAVLRGAEEYLAVEQHRLKTMRKTIKQGGRRRRNPKYDQRKRAIAAMEGTGLPALRELLLAEGFGGDRDRRNTFFRRYRTFANRYMHRSHFPSNTTPGMEAQSCPMSVHALAWPSLATDPGAAVLVKTLRRDIFHPSGT